MAEQKLTVGRIVHYQVASVDDANIKHNHVELLPAVVVRVWSETTVNLKVLTDGPVDVWKTSIVQGDEPGQWNWPARE